MLDSLGCDLPLSYYTYLTKEIKRIRGAQQQQQQQQTGEESSSSPFSAESKDTTNLNRLNLSPLVVAASMPNHIKVINISQSLWHHFKFSDIWPHWTSKFWIFKRARTLKAYVFHAACLPPYVALLSVCLCVCHQLILSSKNDHSQFVLPLFERCSG